MFKGLFGVAGFLGGYFLAAAIGWSYAYEHRGPQSSETRFLFGMLWIGAPVGGMILCAWFGHKLDCQVKKKLVRLREKYVNRVKGDEKSSGNSVKNTSEDK